MNICRPRCAIALLASLAFAPAFAFAADPAPAAPSADKVEPKPDAKP